MSTALATLGDLPPSSKYGPEDDNIDDFTRGNAYLPRLQFFSDQAGICKRRQFPMNHYGLVRKKDDIADLGESFVGVPLAYRYKALDFREKGKVKSHYDPRSKDFIECKAEADKKRPPGEKSGVMYGAEFLVALQVEDKIVLATLLCSTNSWKKAAKKLFPLVRTFVSFGSKLVDGDFVYQSPEVATFSGSFELGDVSKLTKVIAEFTAVSGTTTEEGDEEGANPPATNTSDADRVR